MNSAFEQVFELWNLGESFYTQVFLHTQLHITTSIDHIRRPEANENSEKELSKGLFQRILRQQSNKGTLLINTAIEREANENYELELSKGLFQRILRQQSNKGTLLIITAIVAEPTRILRKSCRSDSFRQNSPSTE